MPKVNVVLPDGRVVAVDEADARAMSSAEDTGREATPGETVDYNRAQEEAARRERVYGGIQGKLLSATGGALDTLTLGAGTRIFGDDNNTYQKAAQENPGWNTAGSTAAFFLPGGNVFGAIRGAGEAVGLGKIGVRLAEGGAAGVGGYVANTNVTGDPLTIEGAVESAGLGQILNLGIGAMADRLTGATWNAKLGVAKKQILAADEAMAESGEKALTDPPPTWDDFRESHSAAVKSARQLNREIDREATKYNDFVGSNSDLTGAIDNAQKLINKIRNERYAPAGAPVEFIEGQPRGVQTGYNAAGEPSRILSPSQPPISEETTARLNGWQQRISRIYKMKSGGYQLEESGKWVRDPSVPPNPQGALEELRTLQTEMQGVYSKASGVLTDLPAAPREPVPVTDVKVPNSPREFARMRPERVAELANSLDPATKDAFARYAQDMGLEVKPNIAETVAGVHEKLGTYADAMERSASAEAAQEAEDGKRGVMWRVLKMGARIAGAKLTGGGFGMRFMGSMLGGELADAALMASREGIHEKVQALVAKWGLPAANAAEKLAPVTAYLANSFPSGRRDPEKDVRKQATNRIAEIQAAAVTAPDTMFSAVQGLMGMSNDVAFKMHQQLVKSLQHLAATTPKDPGLNDTLFGSNWTPAYHETIALAHRLEAAQDPFGAIVRGLTGDGHPAANETLWAMWPAIMQQFAAELSANAATLKKANYQQGSAYSQLFRTPLTGLAHPVVVTTLQGLYLPPPQPGKSGAGGTSALPKQPTGRPPAVRSPVAGSNVSMLIGR